MALTDTELQNIVNAVLSSIRDNSRTIDQLTPVDTLSAEDCFEIGGGKRVTYATLKELIASSSTAEQNTLLTLISRNELLSAKIETTDDVTSLVVATKEKEISCVIPMATVNTAGFMTASDKTALKSLGDSLPVVRATADTAKSATEQLRTRMSDAEGSINAIREGTSTMRTELDSTTATANAALSTATVATQSVNAALSTATEAKETANAMNSRVTAIENRSPFEELASEAEWQARKAAGTLDPNKLYFVAEQ